MNFKDQVTFNAHDTKISVVDGRHVVKLGVRRRCGLVLTTLLNSKTDGMYLSNVTDELNARVRATYSKQDVSYILGRLKDEGLVTCEDQVWKPVDKARQVWSKLDRSSR